MRTGGSERRSGSGAATLWSESCFASAPAEGDTNLWSVGHIVIPFHVPLAVEEQHLLRAAGFPRRTMFSESVGFLSHTPLLIPPAEIS